MKDGAFSKRMVSAFLIIMAFGFFSGDIFALVHSSQMGDFDGDRMVYYADLSILAASWLGSDCVYPGSCSGTDIDLDHQVNFVDLSTFSENWSDMAFTSGIDLFQATGQVDIDIPADFFEPGSDPFSGTVCFSGIPIGTAGPFELGTTSATIFRNENATVAPPPSYTQISVEFSQLSLASTAPITVYINGEPTYWDVNLSVEPNYLDENEGSIDLYRTNPHGGSCQVSIPIAPILTFSRDGQTKTYQTGELVLAGSGNWQEIGYCPGSQLAVPQLNLALCMGVTVSSPQMQLTLTSASIDPYRPGPIIYPYAYIDPCVASIGRYATIRNFAHIGKNVVIGPNAYINEYAVINDDAIIGSNVHVGSYTHIYPDVIVNDDTTIGNNTYIKNGSYIGPGCQIGQGVHIGGGCSIFYGAVIQNGAVLEDFVNGGSQLFIGSYATIGQDLTLASKANVAPYTNLTESLLECTKDLGGGRYVGRACDCRSVGGAVKGLLGAVNFETTKAHPDPCQRGVIVPNDPNYTGWVNDLNDFVEGAVWNEPNSPYDPNIAHDPCDPNIILDPNTPIVDRKYFSTFYDCDKFARDMEKYLSSVGYDATLTIFYYMELDPNWTPAKHGTVRKWNIKCHAITDVHDPNTGKIIWIEPQTGEIVDLENEFDYDNTVGTDDKPGRWTSRTEDGMRIEIYDSWDDAVSKGVKMD